MTDDLRGEAERAVAVYDCMPRGSSPERIASLVGTAALGYAAGRLSERESASRLKLYQVELADIDSDVLAQAFRAVVRACKFFPTIAEIRDAARSVPAPRRMVIAARLRRLLATRAVAAMPDVVDPAAVRDLVGSMGASLASATR